VERAIDKVVQDELETLARHDALWDGKRLHLLLLVSVVVVIGIIYAISSFKGNNWSWSALSHDPVRELPPSGW